MVFLVAQRFDRSGVEGLRVLLLRQIDREVGHHGLAGAGRGRHQYIEPLFQCLVGIRLEPVELERQCVGELGRDGSALPLDTVEPCIPFGRRQFTLLARIVW